MLLQVSMNTFDSKSLSFQDRFQAVLKTGRGGMSAQVEMGVPGDAVMILREGLWFTLGEEGTSPIWEIGMDSFCRGLV